MDRYVCLKNRTWLTDSPSKDALFCLLYVLFESVKKSNVASTGLKCWVLACSKLIV